MESPLNEFMNAWISSIENLNTSPHQAYLSRSPVVLRAKRRVWRERINLLRCVHCTNFYFCVKRKNCDIFSALHFASLTGKIKNTHAHAHIPQRANQKRSENIAFYFQNRNSWLVVSFVDFYSLLNKFKKNYLLNK